MGHDEISFLLSRVSEDGDVLGLLSVFTKNILRKQLHVEVKGVTLELGVEASEIDVLIVSFGDSLVE